MYTTTNRTGQRAGEVVDCDSIKDHVESCNLFIPHHRCRHSSERRTYLLTLGSQSCLIILNKPILLRSVLHFKMFSINNNKPKIVGINFYYFF